jgi:sulfatase modifying factor 1
MATNRSVLVASTLVLVLSAGCKRDHGGGASTAGTQLGGPESTPPANGGPAQKIPAGTLVAGSGCDAVPRITTEELVATPIALGEFTMDEFPYPNDPSKPPLTGVSRDEAAKLCEAEGKRLCTELEWERACKGPHNTTFEYGNAYQPATCAPVNRNGSLGTGVDKRAGCKSGFGVKDMHGLVYEWTDSPWGRGSSGDLGTVRGGFSPAGELVARCANGQSRPTSAKEDNLGFRCCSGPRNAAEVNLTLTKETPIVQDPAVNPALAQQMLATLPADMRQDPSASFSFDQLWRWHPRANEELFVARWSAHPKTPPPSPYYEEMVFKVCSGTPHLLARMKGPVAETGAPSTGSDAQKAMVHVKTDKDEGDVSLEYAYGRIKLEQPAWIKPGSKLAASGVDAGTDAGAVDAAGAKTASGGVPMIRLPGALRAQPKK